MYKDKMNIELQSINDLIVKIKEKNISIEKLLKENESKKNRNYEEYNKRVALLDKKISSIKLLSDNKNFKFISHLDFIDDRNISELKEFERVNDLGCLTKSVVNKQDIRYSKKILDISKKKMTYFFNEPTVSNAINYSFYTLETGLPITPTSVEVVYRDNIDNLFEPHFRFYNRNNSTNFENFFLYEPKKISKVIFNFDKEINSNNDLCKLYTLQYSMEEDNYIILNIENTYNLSGMNIFKRVSDITVPLIFEYSEDNINFTPIEFKGNEGSIILEKSGNFSIKIYADNEAIELKDTYELGSSELYSSDIKSSFGKYHIKEESVESLNDIEITLPLSTYKKIKEDISKLNDIKINDVIEESNGIYKIKNSYIKYITETSPEIDNLKYIDDIIAVETSLEYFNFYIDTVNKIVYTSSFIDNYPFFLSFNFKKSVEQISKHYYTPIIFEISLKG